MQRSTKDMEHLGAIRSAATLNGKAGIGVVGSRMIQRDPSVALLPQDDKANFIMLPGETPQDTRGRRMPILSEWIILEQGVDEVDNKAR